MLRWVHFVMVGLVVVVGSTTAHAGRYKVLIETEPPGATVYFESTESTPVCEKTPCTVDLPATETAVYIQLKNHTPEIEMLDPAKKGQRIKKILKPAIGNLVVEGAKGSRVSIEDVDKGKAPDTFELAEGGYHIVVTEPGGKVIYDDFIEIKAGEDITITPAATTVAGGELPEDPIEGGVTKPGPARARGSYVLASVTTDIGFRKFTYENNMTRSTLREESEAGQVLVGPTLEVWPTEILKLGTLRGLSVMAQFQFHLNSQEVIGDGINSGLTTFWQNLEAAVRYRWTFADMVGVQVSGGYGRDTYRFNGVPTEILLVPDADYQSLRIGARVSAALGKLEPYLVVENRIVFDGGALQTRFDAASASGLHGALGLAARIGAINARLEGGLTQYSWTFSYGSGDMRQASGGSDRISQISVSLGYAY